VPAALFAGSDTLSKSARLDQTACRLPTRKTGYQSSTSRLLGQPQIKISVCSRSRSLNCGGEAISESYPLHGEPQYRQPLADKAQRLIFTFLGALGR